MKTGLALILSSSLLAMTACNAPQASSKPAAKPVANAVIKLDTPYEFTLDSGTVFRYVFSKDTVSVWTQPNNRSKGLRVEVFKDDKGYFRGTFSRYIDDTWFYGVLTGRNEDAKTWERLVKLGFKDQDHNKEAGTKLVDPAVIDKHAIKAPKDGFWLVLDKGEYHIAGNTLTVSWAKCVEGTLGYAMSCTPDPEKWAIAEDGFTLTSENGPPLQVKNYY